MQAMDEDQVNRLPPAGFAAAPAPVIQNSRFAAAAAADAEYTAANRLPPRDAQPPPAAANSRFARAVEEDREFQAQRREERAPPAVQNSRFAAAADADRSNPDSAFGRRDDERGAPGGELRENSRAGGRWGGDGGGDDFERRQSQQREIMAEAGQGRAQWGVPRDGGKSWAERHAEKMQGGEYQLSEPPQQLQREFNRAPAAQPVSTAAIT